MLVSVPELAARLPFVLDADEMREAEGAISDLVTDAQAIGRATWTTPENTPQAVKNLILRAAARHMKNYEGYTVSRAGDETVEWAEQEVSGQAMFTPDEKKMLRQMGGSTPFIGGVGVYAYGQTLPVRQGMVPVSYAPGMRSSNFPMYENDTSPW